jgi:hypothetical protein
MQGAQMNEKQLYLKARQEKMRQREKDERYVRQAATYVQGAVSVLRMQAHQAGTPTDHYRVGYATEQFLWRIMSDLSTLVNYLNYSDDEDDYYMQEDILRDVAELHRALKRHMQTRKLAKTEGRTPEEIAAFAAKATEWLGEHGKADSSA